MITFLKQSLSMSLRVKSLAMKVKSLLTTLADCRYAGPGSQKVTERFRLGWETYLASSESIVYASLDGRGTSSRGNRFKYLLYRNLGSIEIEDQLLAGL